MSRGVFLGVSGRGESAMGDLLWGFSARGGGMCLVRGGGVCGEGVCQTGSPLNRITDPCADGN